MTLGEVLDAYSATGQNVVAAPSDDILTALVGAIGAKSPTIEGVLDTIIFPITSCNQENSRYNPLPFHVRAIGVDRFAHQFRDSLGVDYRILGIPQYAHSDRFVENLLKQHGLLFLRNSVFFCC